MNALHADFNFADVRKVPEVTLTEFNEFVTVMCAALGDDRAQAFAGVLLWARCGIPSRLVEMGLNDTSAMCFAHVMLEHQVSAATGLTLREIADRSPDHIGMNARPLLLSTEVLESISGAFEFIGNVIDALMYPAPDCRARVKVLDQLARAVLAGTEYDSLYASVDVHESVKVH